MSRENKSNNVFIKDIGKKNNNLCTNQKNTQIIYDNNAKIYIYHLLFVHVIKVMI